MLNLVAVDFISLDEVGDKIISQRHTYIIPDVGDTISFLHDDILYTVVSRHFDYINNKVIVRVTDGDIHDFQ